MDASGGRYELRKQPGEEPSHLGYAAHFSTPERSWGAQLDIELASGALRERFEADSPPEWLLAHARAVLRSLWRQHGVQAGAWPRRVTRWRPEARSAGDTDES